MSEITTETNIQQTQQPLEIKERTFDRQSMGYTDRPIDARTQTRNRYLDSVQFGAVKEISVGDTTKIDDLVDFRTKYSKYKWDGIPDGIMIPEGGTYLITGRVFADTSGVDIYEVGMSIQIETKEFGPETTYSSSSYTSEYGTTIPVTYKFDFEKGDKMRIFGTNRFSSDIYFGCEIDITKLS